jgi:hypothetical protein
LNSKSKKEAKGIPGAIVVKRQLLLVHRSSAPAQGCAAQGCAALKEYDDCIPDSRIKASKHL